MDRRVDFPSQHGGVDFLREKALAARFRERSILNHVAAGLNNDNFELGFLASMRRREQASHLARLRQGERRSSSAYFHRSSAVLDHARSRPLPMTTIMTSRPLSTVKRPSSRRSPYPTQASTL